MNAASALFAEIAKKKAAAAPKKRASPATDATTAAKGSSESSTATPTTEAAAPATSNSSSSSSSKYIRRADIEKARQQEYHAEQARREAQRAERAQQKRKAEEERLAEHERVLEKRQRLRDAKEAAEQADAAAAADNDDAEDDDDAALNLAEQITVEAAVDKLRELEQPITLFGESHAQRLRRLRRLEKGDGDGLSGAAPTRVPARSPTPPPLSGGELIIDPKNATTDPKYVRRQLLGWFQLVIAEWQVMSANRDEAVKESFQGQQATKAMEQAIESLQPLFRYLKRGNLDEEIFIKVVDLVVQAQKRRYVSANDIYLRLSIGNAAWPIGVTMVGIHERSAREKLHEKGKSAHIMSDEVTRKYLQSIKRCLNFAQVRWPPEDPMQIMG